MKNLLRASLSMLLFGCTGMPEQVTPVTGFELQRYLGTWYEIARLDHSFERGLTRVTASYSLREDDGVRVLNRGYDPGSGKWKEAEGKAYFVESPEVGRLKVSFFGPFYGGYNIIALDQQDYQYALVAGPDTSYLWILARQPELDPLIVDRLMEQARSQGFDTDALIWVSHAPTRSLSPQIRAAQVSEDRLTVGSPAHSRTESEAAMSRAETPHRWTSAPARVQMLGFFSFSPAPVGAAPFGAPSRWLSSATPVGTRSPVDTRRRRDGS